MIITHFDRSTCRTVQEGALKALEAYATSLGLKILPGRGKFNQRSFMMQIEFATIGENGEANDHYARAYHSMAQFNKALPPLGTKFRSSRFGELTVVGYNTKAKSMPILCRTADGRGVKYAEASFLAAVRA